MVFAEPLTKYKESLLDEDPWENEMELWKGNNYSFSLIPS